VGGLEELSRRLAPLFFFWAGCIFFSLFGDLFLNGDADNISDFSAVLLAFWKEDGWTLCLVLGLD
jgi:hypothetical protein